MSTAATIVVGDLHGCIEELDELLKTVSFVKGRDTLVTVGDLVDRGPDSLGVVRRFRELGGVGVLGNHEEKHLIWRFNYDKRKLDPKHTMPKMERYYSEHEAFAKSLNDDDLKYLRALPLTYKVNDRTVVVHAGMETAKSFEEQGRAVLRCSWLRKDGTKASENELRDTSYWTESYTGPYNVIYGHRAHDYFTPRLSEPVKGVFTLGLDTGCVWGGHLSALYLPTNELVQIRAKRVYKRRNELPLPLFGQRKAKSRFRVIDEA